jgi:glutamate 5-kinase
LLAVGVRSCDGSFEAGDAVEIVADEGGRVIGKGIARLSAGELAAVAGLRSDQVRQRLPGADDEVVHRDALVLYDGRIG